MSELLERLSAWTDVEFPTLEDLGGEEYLWASRDKALSDERLPIVVAALCRAWRDVDCDLATAFVADALVSTNLWVYADVVDIVLCSPGVLPDVIDVAVKAMRDAARGDGLRSDIALEGWARLAMGGWCPSLELRGTLEQRAWGFATPTGEHEVSPYLVRAYSAALSQWNDPSLLEALRALTTVDGVEADAATELGLYHLGVAASATDLPGAIAALQISHQWLTAALAEDDRADAEVFHLVTDAVLTFASGGVVSSVIVAELERRIYDYLLGFVGLAPSWRHLRATSTSSWLRFISALRDIEELDEIGWLEPAVLIAAAAEVYSTHRTQVLVVAASAMGHSPLPDNRATRQTGIESIVAPRLRAGFAAQGNFLAIVDRYIASESARLATSHASVNLSGPQTITALESLRSLLAGGSTSNPKVVRGPVHIPERVRRAFNPTEYQTRIIADAIEDQPELEGVLDAIASSQTRLNFSQEQIHGRIVDEITDIVDGGIEPFKLEVSQLVESLILFASYHLDQLQSGVRRIDWLGPPAEGEWSNESVLADALDVWLSSAGMTSEVERSNVGGGRVDVAIQFARCRFAIEVKREMDDRTNTHLTNHYGAQAVQYAATDVAVTFLAVLEYFPRQTRLDLHAVIWTTRAQLESRSREYALTTLRIQGNVLSPSNASKRVGPIGTGA